MIEKIIQDYSPMYGEETRKIIESFFTDYEKIALINPRFMDLFKDYPVFYHKNFVLNDCIRKVDASFLPKVIDGVLTHYFLDVSSVLIALSLPIDEGQNFLDMCSSPGGKLFTIALSKPNINSTANEFSLNRFHRLRNNIQTFLPEELAKNIKLLNKDGIYFGLKRAGDFHSILLDAPCSSEAHVVRDSQLLKKYTGLRKNLSVKQYALLSSAFLACKSSGYIIYATCSINRNENELVIKKLLKKRAGKVEMVPLDSSLGIDTGYGRQFLPHLHQCGPAFFCLLKKNAD